MQTCWNCNAQQLDGAIFCTECGANLVQREKRRDKTRTSLNQPRDRERSPEEISDPLDTVVTIEPPSGVVEGFSLVMLETGHRLTLEENRELMVGRTDNKRGIVPDIDLGNHGGYDAGVSRRHAIISLHHRNCLVKDLGSANGTFVNNRRLPPNQPTLVNHGDELKFGTLITRVEFGS